MGSLTKDQMKRFLWRIGMSQLEFDSLPQCKKGLMITNEVRHLDNMIPWPRITTTFEDAIGLRRYDEPGMVVRYKGDPETDPLHSAIVW